MPVRRRRADEDGASAVLFALVSLVLFGLAALSVDLGNAYQRRAEVQSQADLAALAAGSALVTSQAAATARATDYLRRNAKIAQDQTAAQVTFPTTTSVRVQTPPSRVDFGIAGIFGLSSVPVTASATVSVGTPAGRSAMVPYYAVSGSNCDYGAQSLTDPAKGQATEILPSDLQVPSQGSFSSRASITSLDVPQLDAGLTSATLVLRGDQLASSTGVGFYRERTETPNRVEVGSPAAAALANSDSTGKTVTVAVPQDVLDHVGVWYVRVYRTANGNNNGWSQAALPLRVGDPLIACGNLSNSGNFGALKLPRTDVNDSTSNGWMPTNIAIGPQSPLSLRVHTAAADPWTCTHGTNGAVASTVTGSPILRAGTNCVATDTGLTATATTAGLVTGAGSHPGRLARTGTTQGVLGRSCAPMRSGSNGVLLGRQINNDTLSCFMINPDTPLSTIASPSYSGGPALDPAIYSSPRFLYVPVLRTDPAKGRSSSYSVVGMRPAFITGETNSSTYNNQVFASGGLNGLTLNNAGNKITTLGVVFFNSNALPTDAVEVGEYVGTGPVSVALVD